MTQDTVALQVVIADALEFRADVLALKYAQAHFGVDKAVYGLLSGIHRGLLMPPVGQSTLYDSGAVLGSARVLFVGVPNLEEFTYAQIREFGRRVLEQLARSEPHATHIALTLHGAEFGLDEVEAFECELAGIVEAIGAGSYPQALKTISFVELDPRRAQRMASVLETLLPTKRILTGDRHALSSFNPEVQGTMRSAGYNSAAKPRVFVAMPFDTAMDDLFHYAIQGASNTAGLLCERADLSSYTGDVLEWIKTRISTATLVIADLSAANPNVYLEVGYAWGRGIPTVLLVKDSGDLRFDVKTQRCLVYKSIKDLEDRLSKELKALA